jgi:hypothetical protein
MKTKFDDLMVIFNRVFSFRDGTDMQEKAISVFKEELTVALKNCRNETLEEAAKVTESFSEECSFGLTHADVIRSLKS